MAILYADVQTEDTKHNNSKHGGMRRHHRALKSREMENQAAFVDIRESVLND